MIFIKTIGIICEYNPFHNGHLYHIEETKKLFKDSRIILIINGYFTQRGEVSIINKEDKTKIALEAGVDLVVELPIIYGTQSADIFAYKSIEILNHFKIDAIVFGSESNNVEALEKIADIQLYDLNYQDTVKELLKTGINYPTALAKALNVDIEFLPNDLLGISYIKAIKEINQNIEYHLIKRTSNYHDLQSNDNIISASNIRHKLELNEDITNYLPAYSKEYINSINTDLLFTLLRYQIITNIDLASVLTVDEGIENRLLKVINGTKDLEDLILKIKSKRYTYNKISRMLLHILLGIKKDDANHPLVYLKVLGFNTRGQYYLNTIKKDLTLNLKPDYNSIQYQTELKAATIYDLLTNQNNLKYELSNKPVQKK